MNNNWMIARNFLEVPSTPHVKNNEWWWNELVSTMEQKPPSTISATCTVKEALEQLETLHAEYLCVVQKSAGIAKVVGLANAEHMLAAVMKKSVDCQTPVQQVMYSQYRTVSTQSTLGKLAAVLELARVALVVDGKLLC